MSAIYKVCLSILRNPITLTDIRPFKFRFVVPEITPNIRTHKRYLFISIAKYHLYFPLTGENKGYKRIYMGLSTITQTCRTGNSPE